MPIDSLAEISAGYWGASEPDEKASRAVDVIRNGDLTAAGLRGTSAHRFFKEREADRSELLPDDLVMTSSGDCGKLAYIESSGLHASNFIKRIRINVDSVLARWLYFALQAPISRQARDPFVSGTTIQNLKKGYFSEPFLSIPPLPEQGRIVEVLEDQISRLDTALESVQAVREKAAQFRRSLLHAAFTGALTGHDVKDGELPEGWTWARVGEVTENHDGVRVPVKRADRAKMQGEYPYYGASGVIDHVDQYLFDGRYLLVSEDGANLTARTKPIAFEATGRFWVNNHAHVLTALSGVSQRYLMYLIDQSSLDGLVTGTAQPKITQRNLVKIPVPLPQLEEQERIVEILEDQLSRLDASFAVGDAVEERSAALRRSLLHSAFTGRLTEEWREAVNV